MPAKSKVQREAMAIAEHHPEELYAKNRGLLKMSHQQLHDFAATREKGLPERKLKGRAHDYSNKRPKRPVRSRYAR